MLVSCVNSDNYQTPDLSGECADVTANKNVLDIINTSTSSYVKYVDATPENADIIEAYVTSSDEGGTFYKSISLVSLDKTKGFSIPVDDYNLYTKYRPGQKVYVNMTNRYIVKENGSTVIGSLYNNETPDDLDDDKVGRISGAEYQSVFVRSCKSISEEDLVNRISIETALNDSYLNKLIEFENVQFVDTNVGKTYFDSNNQIGGATNNLIANQNGATIILRISEFANFASKKIPSNSGKIRGVLTKFGSDYQFIVRTENDIKLDKERLAIDLSPPIGGTAIQYLGSFTENFESYTAGTGTTGQKIFPKYINDSYLGSKYWYTATFSSNKYIVMSAFSSSASAQEQNNKTYFIVPVDFTTANSMSFKTQDRFNVGGVLKVYHSTNYIPFTDIAAATLVDITSNFTIASGTTGSASQPFVNSGVYNLPSSLTGNGFIIFEYVGGYSFNPVLTTTMHIDDIVVN